MKLLAIDTSSSACSLAVLIDKKVISKHQLVNMQQSKLILSMLDELLSESNLKLFQLDAIAFGCGPGSFTGVRIAVGVAQGLGFALNKPLIPISTLAIMAQAAYEEKGWTETLIAIDARVKEVYFAAYQVESTGLTSLKGKEILCKPAEIVVPQGRWYGVGNAWEIYRQQLPFSPLLVDSNLLPHAQAMIPLARDKFLRSDWISPLDAEPFYLRDEVAQKTKL